MSTPLAQARSTEATEPLSAPINGAEEGPEQQQTQSPVPSMTRVGLWKRTLPPGAEDDLKDTQRIRYADRGNACEYYNLGLT